MGITIKEIAELCGVSIGTVDRALNNRPGISEKTKRRIMDIAREHRYQPDLNARGLASGRTMTIGVVLFDLYNRSFAQLANAIESRARERGYVMHLTLTGKDRELELGCIRQLVQRKVDGIILFSVNEGAEFEAELSSLGTPVVTVCNYISDRLPYVGIDDRSGMREAVEYVRRSGYSRFIYICPPLAKRGLTNIYTQEQRWAGFLDALGEAQDAGETEGTQDGTERELLLIEQADYLAELERLQWPKPGAAGAAKADAEATQGHLAVKTAIICSCDAYALEVLHFCKTKGLRVPEDVGIMGFDNIDMLKYVTPRLSTVHYDMEEFGVAAVDSLIAWVEQGEPGPSPKLAYRLIEGESI